MPPTGCWPCWACGEFEPQPVEEELHTPAEPLERLCQYRRPRRASSSPDTRDARDQFDTELMNCLMPRPSQVVREFYRLYQQDKQAATDYYYRLGPLLQLHPGGPGGEGPDVDRPHARMGIWSSPSTSPSRRRTPRPLPPPKTPPSPAIPSLRPLPGERGLPGQPQPGRPGQPPAHPPGALGGEPWFLQYSPYVYYNEHCIVLSRGAPAHAGQPRSRIARLLEFVAFLPHYFVGSNADLPIVGGSILTHDHFQGGRYEFPMAKAPVREQV